LYSKVDLEYTTKVLENYTENNGYFNTKGLWLTDMVKASATYTVNPKEQYKIQSFLSRQFYKAVHLQIKGEVY
jgi:hypothetical protein